MPRKWSGSTSHVPILYLLFAYSEQGTVNVIHSSLNIKILSVTTTVLSHEVFSNNVKTTWHNRYYYYSHFTGMKIEA